MILIAGVLAGIGAMWLTWWLGFAILFVLAHFFLFCNVFRLSRPLELVWAVIFLALAAGTIAAGFPGWPIALGISLGATVVVVLLAMRSPSYHGVGWQRINPGLRNWWERRHADVSDSDPVAGASAERQV